MIEKTIQRSRVTLRQLETFAATAATGSTRRASGLVARSQSATSTALAELEAGLGAQLFDRVGRRLVLNENGRLLLPQATALVEQALELETLFGGRHARPLRLASSFTIGEYLLPPLVAAWKRRHAASQVQLEIANTRAVLESVARFDVDLGFIEGTHTHPDLVVEHWLEDELVVVAARAHPWSRRTVTLEQLAQAAWVMREAGSGTREAADRHLIAALRHVSVDMELGSNEAVKRAVASGLGLGCLSRHAVMEAVSHQALVLLKTQLPRMHRSLAVVSHKDKPLGTSAQDFLAQCRAYAQGHGARGTKRAIAR